jgi:hypothetical protein
MAAPALHGNGNIGTPMTVTRVRKCLIVGTLAILLSAAANATIIGGTFSGTIFTSAGTLNGLDLYLSTLWGSAITGTFTYDSASLPLVSGGSAPSASVFQSLQNTSSPLVITETFGGITYTVSGTNVSEMYDIPASPGNSNSVAFFSNNTYTDPLVPGDTEGDFSFHLTTGTGPSFLSDQTDSGSMGFVYHNSGDINLALGQSEFTNAQGNGTGSIEFAITDASAGPVAPVPEPSTYALMLAGLSTLAIASRRRKGVPE